VDGVREGGVRERGKGKQETQEDNRWVTCSGEWGSRVAKKLKDQGEGEKKSVPFAKGGTWERLGRERGKVYESQSRWRRNWPGRKGKVQEP